MKAEAALQHLIIEAPARTRTFPVARTESSGILHLTPACAEVRTSAQSSCQCMSSFGTLLGQSELNLQVHKFRLNVTGAEGGQVGSA